MSTKEHFYIVRAWLNDEGKPEYQIASDMEDPRFPEGTVWNEETEQWEGWMDDDNQDADDLMSSTLVERMTKE
jgi:hypothetical protein